MIKNVKVYKKPDKSDAFTMVLNSPTNVSNSTGFVIDKIDGLGPVDADVNMSEMAVDGDHYNSSRVGKRNIVLTLKFYSETGTGIEEVRHKSYELFPKHTPICIEVETDERTVYTKGYVEKNDPDIFSSESGNEVSILCEDPKMYGEHHTDSLTVGETTIECDGELENGVILTFTVGSAVSAPVAQEVPAFTISCSKPDGSSQSIDIFSPIGGYVAGDVITINCISGQKSVIWTDTADADHNSLNLISKNPDWITLKSGDNSIRIEDPNSALSSIVMDYDDCYEGV